MQLCCKFIIKYSIFATRIITGYNTIRHFLPYSIRMKNKLSLIGTAMILLTAACSHKVMPGTVEQLKAQRSSAINRADKIKATSEQTVVSRKENTLHASGRSLNDSVRFRPETTVNAEHPDVAYVNNIYKALSRSYADTLAAIPSIDDDSINHAEAFVGSVNFNLRKPNFVIIHHTSQKNVAETFRTFALARTQASAQYLIGRDGKVYHIVNDYLRAWQAGAGKWGNITDMNSCPVGIELDNDGFEPFSDAQINSLLRVLKDLKQRFGIPAANFIGHEDYAPLRKNDPNVHFPWKLLAQHGFGLWWDDTTNIKVPVDFNVSLALRVIGYDVHNLGWKTRRS